MTFRYERGYLMVSKSLRLDFVWFGVVNNFIYLYLFRIQILTKLLDISRSILCHLSSTG